MRTIEVLEQKTIDQIAAGEVVERPASVVKELLENAIDASATAITVEIRDGGTSLIRITDNGAGIPADQVRTAFLRHATSKIRTLDDLTGVASLGFRGEALSSIAAVARVEVITRTPEALTGVRYCIEGGTETEYEEIGAPSGTTFLVRSLFYNTPARAKFLKSPTAEGNRIAVIVEELALSHPDISFKFLLNGQSRLFTSGNGNLREIVYQIYGRDLAKKLITIEDDTGPVRIRGFLGDPEIARGNRNFENHFINGRYVKSTLIARAIEDGYHGFMMQHRYPFTLLYLDIDPELVDVNVHPSKMEVRIQEQEKVYRQLTLAIQNTLFARERIPQITPGPDDARTAKRRTSDAAARERTRAPEPFEQARRAAEQLLQTAVRETPAPYGRQTGKEHTRGRQEIPQQTELFPEKLLEKAARPMHRIIGQVFGTYWLIEFQDALYIVDQHAAHEKVLYERLMAAHRRKEIHAQLLYPAAVVSLTAAERQLLEAHMDAFRSLGFEIEAFGGSDVRINAVPDNLYRVSAGQLFTDILDQLSEPGSQTPEQILERLASMSCRAAVKGNHTMSVREADALIDELLTLENPYNCPHGRPTIVSMTHYELDKKFKRIV